MLIGQCLAFLEAGHLGLVLPHSIVKLFVAHQPLNDLLKLVTFNLSVVEPV